MGTSSLALATLLSAIAPFGARAQQAPTRAGAPTPAINIVADGRTKTTVAVTGAQAAVTTATISNATAYNSFSSFTQGVGSTVNLYLPTGTANLVNIVHGGSVVVDGVLNAYKSGQIGGNVYFSDSQGFIVGQSGVVNVGSLGVNTPTDRFLDSVIGADGSVNDAQAGKLMRGEIPLSRNGFISISGRINAQDGISLKGQRITISGPGRAQTGGDLTQRQKFNATVNSRGLHEGGAMVSRHGVISIVAGGRVRSGGRIKVGGTDNGAGGHVVIKAAGKIALAATARISADGAGQSGAGGNITVKAGTTLDVAAGASFSAHGAGTGAGGFAELSGAVANIGAVRLDLGSDAGVAGTLLIDPTDLVINSTNSLLTGGVAVIMQASNSITIAGSGSIDTTNASGTAGDITLQAPSITLSDGSVVTAAATGFFAAGTVTLAATATDANAQIVIGAATLTGGDISLLATSTASAPTVLATTPTAHATITMTGAQITASGHLQATANASTAASVSRLPVGVVVTDVLATVNVGGASLVHADSAAFSAAATADSKISTSSSLNPASSAADGAVAVSTVTSLAAVHIGDTASLTTAGLLGLNASNNVVSHATASPISATFGASVAVSVVKATTTAKIDGAAAITAGSLTLAAHTTSDITATASATAGGATAPDAGSQASSYLSNSHYTPFESTSEGKVSQVGALALSDLTSTNQTLMASTGGAQISGALTLDSQSGNSANVAADGSAVASGTGVGVALGINLASVKNDATVAQTITAGSLDLGAIMMPTTTNSFTTNATSGAGGKNVGVAGSLAVNLVDTEAVATLASGAAVTITGGGAVQVKAQDNATSLAHAKPDTTGASGNIGVGASVALNIGANRTIASIADGATLDNPGDISLSASAVHTITTEAEAGSSGGISLTPALALSVVNNTTSARLGSSGAVQASSGKISLTAAQQATELTTASGSAAGSKAAVGAALAIALVNDSASATTARSLNATGDVTLTAWSASLDTLSATASASGGAAADSSGAAQTGQDSDVDTTVNKNLTHATTVGKTAGVGDSTQQGKTGTAASGNHSASTKEGKVSVAAAVGVNIQNATAAASVADGLGITSGGALMIGTSANTSGSVTADGSAVGAGGAPTSQFSIGAAVAVNVVHAKNDATLGNGQVSAQSLTVSSLKQDVSALMAHTAAASVADSYNASAKSGAGGSKVGIAGSLGLNLIDSESVASISLGAAVTVTAHGAVSITADNKTSETAKALPVQPTTGGVVGIGASVAINIVANRSLAQIGDNVGLSGAGDIIMRATADHTITTKAEAGAKGGVSIVPVLALAIVANTTSATIGSSTGTLGLSGALNVKAAQAARETTSASAKAAGGKAAIGAALSLALVTDSVSVSTNRAINAGGAVSFIANGSSLGSLTVTAGAKGAKGTGSNGKAQDGGGDTVDAKVKGQLDYGKSTQASSKVGDTKQQNATAATKSKDHSAKSSEGKIAVAAAVGVNVVDASVTAIMPDGKNITAGGALGVTAINATDGTVTADASATGPGTAIGAAASVNAITETNTASLGAARYLANGVSVQALKGMPGGTPHVDVFTTSAKSGAGGSNVGVAGALALNLIKSSSLATVSGSARVNAGSGASLIAADQQMTASASATPLDKTSVGKKKKKGDLGVGASVALNLITTTSQAELTDGAGFANGAGLSVTANSAISTKTEAKAGSAGGIAVDAVVALATLDETTTARIGTGAAMNTAGGVVITASNSGENTATGSGKAKGGSVGVGAAVAVIVGGGVTATDLKNTSATSATLARDLSASALSISASSARSYEAYATASASGAKDKKAADTSSASSTKTLASTKKYQSGKDSKGKGRSNGGKVSVAAAVGVAAAQDAVSATLAGVSVSVTGDLTVAASNTTNIASKGAGAASGSKVGVGVGVALSISNNRAVAAIADNATITKAGDIAVTATTSQNMAHVTGKTDFRGGLGALAYAGSSSKKVSVAGALAVDVSNTKTTALIGDGVNIGSVSRVGTVTVSADNQSRMASKAASVSVSQGSAGIGASVAIVLSQNAYTANIGAGGNITSGAVSVTATNQLVHAPTAYSITSLKTAEDTIRNKPLFGTGNYYAEAIGGAASKGAVAVQGSFAVMVFSDTASARIGHSLASTPSIAVTNVRAGSGDVTIRALDNFEATALSGALSLSGGSAGVGISASVVVSDGKTTGELGQNARLLDAGGVTIAARAAQDFGVFGVSAAGADSVGVAGVASALTSENTVQALVGKGAVIKATGDISLGASNTFKSLSVAGGLGIGGSAGIGAAASAIVVDNTTRAAIANGTGTADAVKIDTGGAVAIDASATETGTTYAVAGGAAGTVGVGAGAAVYVLGTTTEALIGNYAQIGQTTPVGALSVTARDASTLNTYPGAAGVGGSVGAGAGVGVGTLTKTVTASIGNYANVGAKDVAVEAQSRETADMLVISAGVGGAAGLAGAVSVYTITDTTTAAIGANARVFATDNVAVLANDAAEVDTFVGSLAGGGSAGVGAAIGIAVIDTTTHASIADRADVGALGQGAAVDYTDRYDTSFTTFADNFKGQSVDASKIGGATASSSNGVGTTASDAANTGLSLLSKTRNSVPVTQQARGVIVNAAASSHVRSVEIGAAAAGVGAVTLSGNVPIITADTRATIGNAQINKMAGTASAAQGITVAAASDIYDMGVSGAVAGAGGLGAGAGVTVAVVNTTTKAMVASGADMAAAGDMAVTAKAREDFSAMAAAGAGGGAAALAGGVGVIVVNDITDASLGGTALAQGNIRVLADDQTRAATVAGSLAVGGLGGAAGAVSVLSVSKTTTAGIGAGADVTALAKNGNTFAGYSGADVSTTQLAKGLNVAATSGESDLTLGVTASGGGFVGVSGVVTVELMNVTTLATVGDNAKINQTSQSTADAAQDVYVTARDTNITNVIAGGYATGGVALAGSVDVGIIKTTTSATIGNGVVLNARHDLLVNALSNKAGNSIVVSGSKGNIAIAAGVSIYDYGNGITPGGTADKKLGDVSKGKVSLGDITNEASGQSSDNSSGGISGLLSGSGTNTHVTAANSAAQAKRNAISLDTTPNLALPAGTSANIGAATINTGGGVTLQSRDSLTTMQITGARATGGLLGLGAGVGVVSVETTNTARIAGAADITAVKMTLNAITAHSLVARAKAGAAAAGFGLAAAVAVIDDRSNSYAYVNGATLAISGGVAVNTTSSRTADVTTTGKSRASSGAAGISVAIANVGGTTKSALGADASGAATNLGVTIGSIGAKATSVALNATSNDAADATSTAGAGGIGIALQGAVALVDVAPTVGTVIHNATMYVSGALSNLARAANHAVSQATGVAVAGGLAAGASVAHSTLGATVSSDVDSGANLNVGTASIGTSVAAGQVSSKALAGSGALVGIAGSDAKSANNSTANTRLSKTAITASGQVTVNSANTTSQRADASGFAVGLIGLGSNNASATSNTASRASMTDMTGVTVGALDITADGSDRNEANATAGSGGVIAGAASQATTSAKNTTEATATTTAPANKYLILAVKGTAASGTVSIKATHTANFAGKVNSTQASVVGASGATLRHSVDATVNAALGDNAYVRATNLAITAKNLVHNFFAGEGAFGLYPVAPGHSFNADSAGWNVDSGSGGLVNLPAGSSTVTITQTTAANIGADADIRLLLPTSSLSSLSIEAYNETIAHQKAKLDSAGLVALAASDIVMNATQKATVNIGDGGAIIVDKGDINIAAWGNADLEGHSAATTYGLAGAPSGKAHATLGVTNNVAIGQNVRLEASTGIAPADGTLPTHGTVTISAGDGLSGTQSALNLTTTMDLFNNAAIPISGSPDAQSTLSANSAVTQGTTTASTTPLIGILAAGNIAISADRGNISLSAIGIGKDIYREALAKVASAISKAFGGDKVTFDYHGGSTASTGTTALTLNGLIATGLQRNKTLTVSYKDNCTVSQTTSCLDVTGAIPYAITTIKANNSVILQRLKQLQTLIANAHGDTVAKGAYQSEIAFLEQKLVGLGLGTFNASGDFTPKAYAAGLSPYDILLAQKTAAQGSLTTVTTDFTAQAFLVKSAYTDLATQIVKDYNNNGAHDFASFTTAAKTTIKTLSKYTTALNTPATILDGHGNQISNPAYAPAQTFLTTFNTKISAIDTKTTTANGYQASLDSLVATGNTLQTAINTQIGIINDTGSTSSAVTTAKATLANKMNAVVSNNAAIAAKSASLHTAMNDIHTDLVSLTAQANSGNAVDTNIVTGLNTIGTASGAGALWATDHFTTNVSNFKTAIDTQNLSISDKVGVLTGAVALPSGKLSIDTYTTKATGFVAAYNTADGQLSGASRSKPTTPETFLVNVHDVAARLGNIYLTGNLVTGGSSGILSAPGDASIKIINNTAASLQVNNITMPSYDAGHVRVNGVLVNANADVTALNANQHSANFAKIVTGQSSSRQKVTIKSNYNPNSAAYYNPIPTAPTWQQTLKAPPDIIVEKLISSPNGNVNITSAAGDIAVHGAIKAASLNILARNGDFVSSYVNGFDHVGGDPAGFNLPSRAAEAGAGLTINGPIAISARYLNINSTIQSGIVDPHVTLSATTKLTVNNPGDIGLTTGDVTTAFTAYRTALTLAGTSHAPVSSTTTLTNSQGQQITLNLNPTGLDQTQLVAAIATYKAAIVSNPTATPLYTIATTSSGTKTINIKDFLSRSGLTPRLEFSVAKANAYKAAAHTTGLIYKVVASGTDNIGVSYDVDKAQYLVDGTEVHGGYIQIYGQILNTASSGGQLNVLDGFGAINVTNTSAIPLVLSTLNAGTNNNHAGPNGTALPGRGTAGKIDITDIKSVVVPSNPNNPSTVTVKHTVYTRAYTPGDAVGHVVIKTETGTLDPVTGAPIYGGAVTTNTTADRSANYATTANQRYIWTTSSDIHSQVDVTKTSTQLFGTSALTIDSHTQFDSVTTHSLGTARLADGTYLSQNNTPDGSTQFNSSGQILFTDPNYNTVTNSSLSGVALKTADHSFLTKQDFIYKYSDPRNCNWLTLCIASSVTSHYTLDQYYTTIKTHSLKADNPIAINFIGQNKAAVSVSSNANITLTGGVSALSGAVGLAANTGASAIIQGNSEALITGSNIKLTAASSIGSLTGRAVRLKMSGAGAGDGALVATAGAGNVNLASINGLVIDKVTADGSPATGAGTVRLTAATNISATKTGQFIDATTRGYVQAPRVILSAVNGSIGGSIGSGTSPLLVNTGFSLVGRVFGDPATNSTLNQNPDYGLSALAAGDIGLETAAWSGNSNGTMMVDQVVSLGGDVRLDAAGQILDNNPVQSIDKRTYNQLLNYWNTLGLVRGTPENTAKVALAIKAYGNGINADYQQYWKIRSSQPDGGAAYDAGYSYTIDLASQLGKSLALTMTPTEITAYAAAQTATYHRLNAEVGGLTSSYDPRYVYAPTAADKAKLSHGADWSKRQLAFSLSPGALKTVTGTNPVRKAANVSGRHVTLNAGFGIGETAGAGTASLGVDIPVSRDPSLLTSDQKVALAAAERSDIELIITAITLPVGSTAQQRAVFGRAIGLGLLGATTVVPAGKNYADLTPQQQTSLDAAAYGLVPAAQLTIRVLPKRPLNFAAATELSVAVTALPTMTLDQGNVYLSSRGLGRLGTISTNGETRIKTRGAIVNVGSGVVSTGKLILESAQGGIGTGIDPFNIGTHFRPLKITPKTGATITARAQGGIDLDVNGAANVDTIYSPQNVTLTASGDILNANHDLLINILGTDVALSASSGNIGVAGNALNVGVNLHGGITATAPTGAIHLYGPAGNSFVIQSAKALNGISLQAGNEAVINGPVETAGALHLITGGLLALTRAAKVNATADDITVSAGSLRMFNGAKMTATLGNITITTTTGDALVTGVTSGASVTIDAAGHVLAGTDPTRVDITALATNALVKITAGLGIGDQTEANSSPLNWPYDGLGTLTPIAATANPLIIKTHKIDLLARAGDVNAQTPLDITDATLKATNGSIAIVGAGSFHSQSMISGGSASIITTGNLVADLVMAGTGGTGGVHLETQQGALTVGTSTSAGSQTLLAMNDVTFTQITTATGASPADPGNVEITTTSRAANNGVIKGGSINAVGAVTLNGNGIDFANVTAGTNATFVAAKDIRGHLLQAGDTVDLTAGTVPPPTPGYLGTIAIDTVRARNMTFDTTGDLTLPDLEVAKMLMLRGGNVTAKVTQVPSGPDPLQLTLTGGRGSVGTRAVVSVDAPAGLKIGDLKFVDTTLGTTAHNVSIANAYVPGALWLTTPLQTLLFDDRTPLPHYNANVQFHQQTFGFWFNLRGYYSISNAYVVQYNVSPDSANNLISLDFNGAGLVRDTIRVTRNGLNRGRGPGTNFWRMDSILPPGSVIYVDGKKLIIDGVPYDIMGAGSRQGRAVRLGNSL